MSGERHRSAAEIRAGLGHPVIDADGHWLEHPPLVEAALARLGGRAAADGFVRLVQRVERSLDRTVEERRRAGQAQEAFWGFPARNTVDRATALLPGLLYERLDELGIDVTVLYPTRGLGLAGLPDTDQRRAACRAFNAFQAEWFGPFADRITPVAVIPVVTPDEAIAELEHVRRELGLKAVVLGSLVRRPMAVADGEGGTGGVWLDVLGLDSDQRYDELWAACVELGVAPTFHTGSRGTGLRLSPSNFTFNHIGHFAAANEAVCKALFLGGVTRRFPDLRVAFLEGGVGWACGLYADLIGHWEKRSRAALEETNPANLDRPRLVELAERYGPASMVDDLRRGDGLFVAEASPATGGLDELDDFAACRIARAEDIRDLFVEPFFFGCEADDALNAWGFARDRNPFGTRLNALFGSDIGHFDVVDMADVLPEAYELVEDGAITADDFRDFVFTNPARLWTGPNPAFFEGTVVAGAVDALLHATPAA